MARGVCAWLVGRGSRQSRSTPPTGVLVELHTLRSLIRSDAPGNDLRLGVGLRANGAAGHPAQQRELSDVGQRIGDRSLKDLLDGLDRRPCREPRIEARECGEDALPFFVPRPPVTGSPTMLTVREPNAPFEEVADVRQNLQRSAHVSATRVVREIRRNVANYLLQTIGEGGQSMPEKRELIGHGSTGFVEYSNSSQASGPR
jgi:hypothetical protein